ncbi:hypothetical protein ACT6P1_08805 [Enterococcus lactis]|uniref:hypothetical protein n=1 Tax=Enterococcus lactis TaxID=357441 RepID=UPI004043809C
MKSKIKLFLTTCLLAVAFAIPITTVHADTDTQQILEEYYEEFKNEYASFDQTFENSLRIITINHSIPRFPKKTNCVTT